MRVCEVGVRTLCEFAARHGDLDLRHTGAPTAQQGQAGHQAVTARRPAPYRTEVALSSQYRHLVVRGRADGYDPVEQRLDEIKTVKTGIDPHHHLRRELHWAQALVYGWMMCESLALPQVSVALVYFDVVRQQEASPQVRRCDAQSLRLHFEALCERYLDWADRELAHRTRRNADLRGLRFGHGEFRRGQRDFAAAVYNAARSSRCLLAQAPTGIGKTLAALFPALKAVPGQGLDKLYYLTAKESGRGVALQALADLRQADAAVALRCLELVARDKACEHPDKLCHGDSCPLARGFYDRLPAARAQAVDLPLLDRQTLRAVAAAHGVCPYHLGQELVAWCDVVVGDYNHYFDSAAVLHGLTAINSWRVMVLVDEAHNLVERARDMHSAALDPVRWQRLAANAPQAARPALRRLLRAWQQMSQGQTAAYQARDSVPRHFAHAVELAMSALTECLAQLGDTPDPELQQCQYEGARFARLVETIDTHSMFDLAFDAVPRPCAAGGDLARPCVRNVVPAPFLAPRFALTHATVLFSATLTPVNFYLDTLGLPASTVCLALDAPFTADQLSVHIARHVSTRFRDRASSLAPIATLIAEQYGAQPGNYLAFFSSFDYLALALHEFRDRFPHVPCWEQGRRMDSAQRGAFLARFEPEGQGIGFAVLGGAFAEGIDLPGRRLIGAFIATLGMPQFNPVNEAVRQRLEQRFGAGFDYTYLFPGLRKVVQAAGRVVRSPSDRGSVHLIDDRFDLPQVRRLLPPWWRVSPPVGPAGRPQPAHR